MFHQSGRTSVVEGSSQVLVDKLWLYNKRKDRLVIVLTYETGACVS